MQTREVIEPLRRVDQPGRASAGHLLGCSRLALDARPAAIIIERQQKRANWHETRNVRDPPREPALVTASPVIKVKEYKLRRDRRAPFERSDYVGSTRRRNVPICLSRRRFHVSTTDI